MRELAIKILYNYKVNQSYINIDLNHALDQSNLSREDKDLLTHIVYGTIQNEIYLEYQLEPFIKGKIKPYEKVVLLMSLYQILFLTRIPDYAVINEAVEIVKKKKGQQVAKFINAILRNVLRQGKREIDTTHPLFYLSIQYSMPLWLVKMFHKQLGETDTQLILESYLQKPRLTARVNTLFVSREELLSRYPEFTRGILSEDAMYLNHGNIAHHTLFKEGKITIQDESSQLVARLLNPSKDSLVLDMCSAPGSKTTHLGSIMENTGCIKAFDIHEHKIRLIEENASRLHVNNIEASSYDATKLEEILNKETFDHVLLDAPCSGFGVIGRKPEIKYQAPGSMDEIITLQCQLLGVAYQMLKHGGTMVYSTCTLNKKENQLQINAFINKYPDMEIEEERLILPHEYHSDGFYMCKLRKR